LEATLKEYRKALFDDINGIDLSAVSLVTKVMSDAQIGKRETKNQLKNMRKLEDLDISVRIFNRLQEIQKILKEKEDIDLTTYGDLVFFRESK
jgi:hypothetical protein